MKIYIKYLLNSLIAPLIITILSLTIIALMSQWLRFINITVNYGLGLGYFIKITIFLLPSLLFITIPISIYIVSLYIYYKFNMDKELVIFTNSGLSRLDLAKPLIIVASFFTIFSYFLSLYLVPLSYGLLKNQILFYNNNYASMILEEGVFNNNIKNIVITIDEYKEGKLKGIFIKDDRNKEQNITIFAKYGEIINRDQGTQLSLFDGNTQILNQNKNHFTVLYFKNFLYDISLEKQNHYIKSKEFKELYLHELLNYENQKDPELSNLMRIEAHQRIIWPLYNILITLIAFSSIKSFTRKQETKSIISISFAAIIIMSIASISKLYQITYLGYLYLAVNYIFFYYLNFIKNR